MTEWFVEDGYEVGNRRITEEAGYEVHEEKIGDVNEPDYTMLTVFEDDEVVAGATYEGDGRGLEEAAESHVDDDFEYNNPVSLLNNPEIRADGDGNASGHYDFKDLDAL